MTDSWQLRLSEYLDEELDRVERAALEDHLARCSSCAATLEGLRRVRHRAGALEDSPPPPQLWAGIEARIGSPRATRVSAELIGPRPGRQSGVFGGPFVFSLPQLLAACLAVALVSGSMVYHFTRTRQAPPPVVARNPVGTSTTRAPILAATTSPSADGPPRVQAPAPVVEPAERTERTPHEEAIAELKRVLARDRDRLDPSTIRTLESNLAIIELAIDQAKRALTADPSNPYVKEHLADTMRRKVELLQRATLLASASPSEESR